MDGVAGKGVVVRLARRRQIGDGKNILGRKGTEGPGRTWSSLPWSLAELYGELAMRVRASIPWANFFNLVSLGVTVKKI